MNLEIIKIVRNKEEIKEIEDYFVDYTTVNYDVEKGNITLPFIVYKDNGSYYVFDKECMDIEDSISLNENKFNYLLNTLKKELKLC